MIVNARENLQEVKRLQILNWRSPAAVRPKSGARGSFCDKSGPNLGEACSSYQLLSCSSSSYHLPSHLLPLSSMIFHKITKIVVYVECYLSSGACDRDACPALLRSTGTAGLAAFPDCCRCRGSADLEIFFSQNCSNSCLLLLTYFELMR